MPIHDYPPFEFEPRKLSKEEINDPYLAITDFFSHCNLPEVRELLWDWMKLTVSGDFNLESVRNKANLLFMYDKIEKLIEATHIIYRSKKNTLEIEDHLKDK